MTYKTVTTTVSTGFDNEIFSIHPMNFDLCSSPRLHKY